MKTWIVIAAFNEGKSVGTVVNNLHSAGYKNIVVVNDGSQDNTDLVASAAGADVVSHIINRGQGAALKTGMDYALEQGADIIVHFDADGQHKVGEIKQIIEPIQQAAYDIALGSRFLEDKSNTPFIRKLFLKGGAIIHFLLYRIKLTDSHNGFRAMSRKAAQKLDIKSDGMEHASEIIDLVSKNKLKYIEVPVTITYTDYSKARGQSTWNAFNILAKNFLRKLMR